MWSLLIFCFSELDNIPRTSDSHYGGCHQVPGVSGRDQVSHGHTGHMSTTGYKYPSYHNEQENRFPGTRRILSAYGKKIHDISESVRN